ncbi:MAG: hypothetical protein U0R68_15900 [Candidatus Nanopelagicales bacterium]
MRSLVLKAGTVAGVVAVLALPATAAQAATTAAATTTTTASSSASTGRIVSGEALAAAVVVAAPSTSAYAGPAVQRRPLGSGIPSSGYAVVAGASS